ncbi:RNA-splicing ligase RtcB [Nocardioides thalensis]|uniref:3'-phosphate/5'-hydroxy nucleic acid ligase n=1 Tax=Nocardioides thalensis TaxID=1914755 RepID=A0A853C0Q9_9ACTN|nr:RtcB family protein [Nocardioides thalensis]NYI99942.1 RNA-splicing ligase RtcB [Nocardioides thalensis]
MSSRWRPDPASGSKLVRSDEEPFRLRAGPPTVGPAARRSGEGKELAERHIYEAKGLEHNLGLPDRDLAVFLSGTPQMEAYLRDLYWAQEYAARNRAVMDGPCGRRCRNTTTGRISVA